jgi:2-oxoisovalerate dehydrogenase E1 component
VIAGVSPEPRHWHNVASLGADLAVSTSVAPLVDTPRRLEAAEGEPIIMPFGDLTVSEGKVVRWAKQVGDKVSAGELVAEIETDKAVVEIEAPIAGVLARILEPAGAVVPMGGQIGLVRRAS